MDLKIKEWENISISDLKLEGQWKLKSKPAHNKNWAKKQFFSQ